VREEAFPDRFDFRSARVRLFNLRLASREGLVNSAGQVISGVELLSEHSRSALVRLFSAPRGASSQLKKLLQGAGNRFLINPAEDGVFRDRLKFGPEFSDEALAAHFIDAEGIRELRRGNMEAFLKRRLDAMEGWDRLQWEACKQEEFVEVTLFS
jgi:hypothetical protein